MLQREKITFDCCNRRIRDSEIVERNTPHTYYYVVVRSMTIPRMRHIIHNVSMYNDRVWFAKRFPCATEKERRWKGFLRGEVSAIHITFYLPVYCGKDRIRFMILLFFLTRVMYGDRETSFGDRGGGYWVIITTIIITYTWYVL